MKTGPDPLKSHKSTKPAFNVWSSSARKRNAISVAFQWRADDGPLLVVFGSPHPSSANKTSEFDPSDTSSGSVHENT